MVGIRMYYGWHILLQSIYHIQASIAFGLVTGLWVDIGKGR